MREHDAEPVPDTVPAPAPQSLICRVGAAPAEQIVAGLDWQGLHALEVCLRRHGYGVCLAVQS